MEGVFLGMSNPSGESNLEPGGWFCHKSGKGSNWDYWKKSQAEERSAAVEELGVRQNSWRTWEGQALVKIC
jgi:hypothetical protein